MIYRYVNMLIKKTNQIKNVIINYFRNTCFYAILLIKPLKERGWLTSKYTNSHFHKGENYEIKFEIFPGRKIIWDIEKKILDKFLLNSINLEYLDFAGGTGRILNYLQKKCKKKYLIDSSRKMVEHAKSKIKDVNYIDKDFNEITNFDQKFDLITAFRFFPNAEPLLREKAMKFISEHLKKDGYLILNNHKNFWSVPFFFKRLTFRSDGFGFTHKDIQSLLRRNNLKIVDFYSCGLFIQVEKGKFIPWSLVKKLENFFHKFLHKSRLGYNVLYLIKKND